MPAPSGPDVICGSEMRKVLRWLLTPLAAVSSVVGVIIAGRWTVTLADARCPSQSMIGGACVEPWHTGVVEAVIYVGLVLAAAGLVVLISLIAPALKRSSARPSITASPSAPMPAAKH